MADKYTVGLYTLGCKVSQYETEAIREAFVDAGFESYRATRDGFGAGAGMDGPSAGR